MCLKAAMCAFVHWVMTPEEANSKSENCTYLRGCGLLMKDSLMGALSLSGFRMVCLLQKMFLRFFVLVAERPTVSAMRVSTSHTGTHADRNLIYLICLG